jgi:hypothetical protein
MPRFNPSSVFVATHIFGRHFIYDRYMPGFSIFRYMLQLTQHNNNEVAADTLTQEYTTAN